MTGILDVGGGMRGIFGAGVTDCLLDEKVYLPYCIGVSAGSANLISYIAKQRGRNYRFYTRYAMRPEYMSLQNFLKKRSYFDLDYVYGTLSVTGGEDPVDYDAFFNAGQTLITVATRADNGKPQYFTNADFHTDDLSPLKGSCAIPGVCKPYKVGDSLYFDGGVADPVPVEKALADGCDRLLVVLTKPLDFVKKPEHFRAAYTRALRAYPNIVKELKMRADVYNRGVEKARALASEGRAVILAPAGGYYVTAFTKNEKKLERLYREGYEAAQNTLSKLKL